MINKRLARFFSRCVLACLSVLITIAILTSLTYLYVELQLPDVSVLRDAHMQMPLRIYSHDHQLIAEFGNKRRIPIILSQVPKRLIQAVLAVEDARFYEHPGVDLLSLIRAAKAVISSGRKVQGASTITMQVARNFFLTRKKTYWRKVKEVLLALKIDQTFSKDKILELYLNKVYFGNRAYGVAAAARVYYGKSLRELTLAEMAMLAGLPQSPSRNNPLRHPKNALKRRNHVLKRMLEVNAILPLTYQHAIRAPLTAQYHPQRSQVKAPYVAEMVRQRLFDRYGDAAYEHGFSVITTLISDRQNAAKTALSSGLIAYSERHGYRQPVKNLGQPTPDNQKAWLEALQKWRPVNGLQPAVVVSTQLQTAEVLCANHQIKTLDWSGLSWARPRLSNGLPGPKPQKTSDIIKPGDLIWLTQHNHTIRLAQIPKIQGAIIAMNAQSGAITALSGGFDYDLSHFNRATQAMRQTGSVFKPFLYSAALAKGFTLASIINDAPIVMHDSGENALWRPHNDQHHFYGPTRLREGLIHSRNLVSIRLLQSIGIPFARDYLKYFGFTESELPNTLSLALGTGLTTPLKITTAYATLANEGCRPTPYFIEKIIDQSTHQVVFSQAPETPIHCKTTQQPSDATANFETQQITPQNAYLMTKVLQDVITQGTGRAARALKRTDLAGKTGTTNDKVDAWFVGFQHSMVTTVWVGFDDSTSTEEYGSQAALPIWIQYMHTALRTIPEQTIPEPPHMITVRIDPKTGLLAAPNQPHAIFEIFRKGHEPTEMSTANAAPSTTVMSQKNLPLF